jgi:hypothetical protein
VDAFDNNKYRELDNYSQQKDKLNGERKARYPHDGRGHTRSDVASYQALEGNGVVGQGAAASARSKGSSSRSSACGVRTGSAKKDSPA